VYYYNTNNEFIVKLNNDTSIQTRWKESPNQTHYIHFYHLLLEEKTRINEPKLL
jgi:hypothetical protein